MNTKIRRFTSVFIISLVMSGIFASQVSAAGSSDINSMGNKIMEWYYLIRNKIAVPLLIVSFSSCGFRILGAGFQSKSDQTIHEAYIQFLTSSLALLVLFLLPYLIGTTREMLEQTRWRPPAASIILPFPYSFTR